VEFVVQYALTVASSESRQPMSSRGVVAIATVSSPSFV
jgi:hypothetical protein